LAYGVAIIINLVDVFDPGRVVDAEVRAALGELNLSVETEWGLYFVLISSLAGAALAALIAFRERSLSGDQKQVAPAAAPSMPPPAPAVPAAQVAAEPTPTSAASTAGQVAASVVDAVRDTAATAGISLPSLPSTPIGTPLRTAAQIVVGRPGKQLPIFPVLSLLVALGVLGGGGYAAYYASEHVDIDKDSLPLIGTKDKKDKPGGDGGDSPATLVSLSTPCRDAGGQACNLLWDVTSVRPDASGLRIGYELRATGQAGCSVALEADKGVVQKLEAAGRPGPFLEGARGRYYPLMSSEGFGSNGGNLACDAKQTGAWVFAPAAGESFVKLRYPGIPSARIELSPVTARLLPAEDPLSVIPVQATACQTVQNQPCRGAWEIGPYGAAGDGSPIVFFAVRFDGPPNCQVNWQADTTANKDLIARGDKGIRLILGGGAGDLALTDGGGLSTASGPQACGRVFTGFWRFAKGNLTSSVELAYPDFPNVQIPIKP
jgi:hypothetical protein